MTFDYAWNEEFGRRLKGLMAFRVVFALFLFGSTVFFARHKNFAPTAEPILLLYAVSLGVLGLSLIYTFLMPFVAKQKILFTYAQLAIDSAIVTVIIYITGCFASVFSFLYLIVIISACFLLFRKGGMIIASLCSIQYGLMIDFEYYGLLRLFEIPQIFSVTNYTEPQVLYKMVITISACFAVAWLTSILVVQERKAQKNLADMKKHVKRVKKMAAIGEMAAGLAHEIKNPLAALSGAIQMLNEDPSLQCDEDKARLENIIRREIKRLNSLVTNFLLFAKPHQGKVKTIPLDTTVADLLDLFAKGVEKDRKITCIKDISPGIWINMDPEYLHQILWNVLINASDAIAEKDDPTGTITVGVYQNRNKMACISIKDDGCGIPPDVLASVFDPFFTTKTKGTGLGLSVAHRIMESYNGLIVVDSQPGEGTTFTFKIPAEKTGDTTNLPPNTSKP